MTSLPSEIELGQVLSIKGSQEFNDLALRIFSYQRDNNPVYNTFLQALGRPEPKSVDEIPCLPISAFKTQRVLTGDGVPELTFSSSGTTGQQRSRHEVLDPVWYEQSFERHFEECYGPVEDLCILGLLPSYIEQGGSSLVYMVDKLIKGTGYEASGTYLHDHASLRDKLISLQRKGVRTILIGVSYALLDFVEEEAIEFPELIVMETGGMKGRRREIIREELHAELKAGFGVTRVHSEYGMTELLSQAYSADKGQFYCPNWMQVRVRDIMDPFSILKKGKTGGIDIIDLANVHSCSFISTDDLGRLQDDGSFEVLGRFDNSDIRGCSLMV